MNITFANRYAGDLGGALGIPLDRQNEISDALDTMVKEFSPAQGTRMVYMVDIIEKIQNFTATDNEFLYAFTNHVAWLYRTGRAVNPSNR